MNVDLDPRIGAYQPTNREIFPTPAESFDDHLKFPDAASLEDIERDLPFLYQQMASPVADTSVKINQFIRYLSDKLPTERQIEFYLKAADFYPFIKDDAEISFIPVWLTVKALSLSNETNEEAQERLDRYEFELINHPGIDDALRRHFDRLLGQLKVLMQTDIEQFHLKYAEYLQKVAKTGKIRLIEECYKKLKNLLGIHSFTCNDITFKERTELASKLKLPVIKPFVGAWRDFRKDFHCKKGGSNSTAEFSPILQEIIRDIFRHSHAILRDVAPCGFVLLEDGSIFRRDATTSSDFDCAFFIDDNKFKSIFIQQFLPPYLGLGRFYLGCLDNTWVVNAMFDAFPIERVGCDIDKGNLEFLIGSKNIKLNHPCQTDTPLVNDPETMFKWITRDFFSSVDDSLILHPRNLFFAQPIFTSSDCGLFERYQNLLSEWWKGPELDRWKVYENFIRVHLNQFNQRYISDGLSGNSQRHLIVNIKQAYIHPIVQWCFDLAFHLKLSNTFTVEGILARLWDHIPYYFIFPLESRWLWLLGLRWEKHKERPQTPEASDPNRFFIKNVLQHEPTPPNRLRLPVLSAEENEYLNQLDNMFLQPAYALLQRLSVTQTVLDPLLALCQVRLLTLPANRTSQSQIIGNIINQLGKRNIFLYDIVGLDKIKDSIVSHQVNIPDAVLDWLVKDYQRHSQEKRIVWFNEFLKIDAFFGWFHPKSINSLIEKLVYLPAEDGWRLSQDLEILLFCEQMREIVTKRCDDSLGVELSLVNLDDPFSFIPQTYFIKRMYREQVLNNEAQFIEFKHDVPSQHTTLPIRVEGKIMCWIKICPENASKEEIARQISSRLTGGDIPPSLIGQISAKGRSVPMLILQHINGIRMSDSVMAINNILKSSFTKSFMRIFVCCPEDDKPEDYYLKKHPQGKFILKRGDNERQFCKSMEGEFFNFVPAFKSIIFFLDLMKEFLDPHVIDEVLSLKPQKLAKSVVEHMHKYHQLCQKLFTLKTVSEVLFFPEKNRKIWNLRMSDVCVLPVYMNKHWLVKLFGNLSALYWRLTSNEISGIDLLRSRYPKLFNAVKYGWKNPSSENLHISLRRLDGLKAYKQNESLHRVSTHSGLYCNTKPYAIKNLTLKDVEEAFEDKNNSPSQALAIIEDMEKNALNNVRELFLKDDPNFLSSFCNLFTQHQYEILEDDNKESITEFQLKQLLLAMVKTKAKIHALDLRSYSKILTNELLEGILRRHGKRLMILNLSNCHLLTDYSISLINNHCKNLKVLTMDNCFLVQPPQFRVNTLEKLFLRKNFVLLHLNLHGESLHYLDVSDSNLRSGFTLNCKLRYLNISNCKSLSLSALSRLFYFNFELDTIVSDNIFEKHASEILAVNPCLLSLIKLPKKTLLELSRILSELQDKYKLRINKLDEKRQKLLLKFLIFFEEIQYKRISGETKFYIIKQMAIAQKDNSDYVEETIKSSMKLVEFYIKDEYYHSSEKIIKAVEVLSLFSNLHIKNQILESLNFGSSNQCDIKFFIALCKYLNLANEIINKIFYSQMQMNSEANLQDLDIAVNIAIEFEISELSKKKIIKLFIIALKDNQLSSENLLQLLYRYLSHEPKILLYDNEIINLVISRSYTESQILTKGSCEKMEDVKKYIHTRFKSQSSLELVCAVISIDPPPIQETIDFIKEEFIKIESEVKLQIPFNPHLKEPIKKVGQLLAQNINSIAPDFFALLIKKIKEGFEIEKKIALILMYEILAKNPQMFTTDFISVFENDPLELYSVVPFDHQSAQLWIDKVKNYKYPKYTLKIVKNLLPHCDLENYVIPEPFYIQALTLLNSSSYYRLNICYELLLHPCFKRFRILEQKTIDSMVNFIARKVDDAINLIKPLYPLIPSELRFILINPLLIAFKYSSQRVFIGDALVLFKSYPLVIVTLEKYLNEKNTDLRRAALETLIKCQSSYSKIVPLLLDKPCYGFEETHNKLIEIAQNIPLRELLECQQDHALIVMMQKENYLYHFLNEVWASP